MSFCRLLCWLIGVSIAASTIPSIAGAQTVRVPSPENGEAHKTETHVAGAQTNPATILRVVVPCPVGSPADIVARRLARMLSESDQQLYVENVPSGAGNPTVAEQAQADDRTLFLLPAAPTLHSACGD